MPALQTFTERLKQRRSQMLIHSYLYYQLDSPIISDDQWQQWANELTEMQEQYPNLTNINFYDKEFNDWNGSTGMHLPTDTWIRDKALRLLGSDHEALQLPK